VFRKTDRTNTCAPAQNNQRGATKEVACAARSGTINSARCRRRFEWWALAREDQKKATDNRRAKSEQRRVSARSREQQLLRKSLFQPTVAWVRSVTRGEPGPNSRHNSPLGRSSSRRNRSHSNRPQSASHRSIRRLSSNKHQGSAPHNSFRFRCRTRRPLHSWAKSPLATSAGSGRASESRVKGESGTSGARDEESATPRPPFSQPTQKDQDRFACPTVVILLRKMVPLQLSSTRIARLSSRRSEMTTLGPPLAASRKTGLDGQDSLPIRYRH